MLSRWSLTPSRERGAQRWRSGSRSQPARQVNASPSSSAAATATIATTHPEMCGCDVADAVGGDPPVVNGAPDEAGPGVFAPDAPSEDDDGDADSTAELCGDANAIGCDDVVGRAGDWALWDGEAEAVLGGGCVTS